MKKQDQRKLVLNKTTITQLDNQDLKTAKGGTILTITCLTCTLTTLFTTVIDDG